VKEETDAGGRLEEGKTPQNGGLFDGGSRLIGSRDSKKRRGEEWRHVTDNQTISAEQKGEVYRKSVGLGEEDRSGEGSGQGKSPNFQWVFLPLRERGTRSMSQEKREPEKATALLGHWVGDNGGGLFFWRRGKKRPIKAG